jgi:hypothetical protein
MGPKMSWNQGAFVCDDSGTAGVGGGVAMDNFIQVPLNLPDVRVLAT